MTLLPVVGRELRVTSRHAWTYWGRALVAACAMAVVGWLLLTMSRTGTSTLAKTLFWTLSTISFGFTLLAGVLFSADSFARERREGTLGLLFLTDLKSLDIALGKLAATSLGSVYCLIAVLPVLAIPLILGGISAAEYVRMVVALLSTLWVALATGLLASTLAQEARNASIWAILLMFGICFGVPALGELLHLISKYLGLESSDSITPYTFWASPFTQFAEAFDSGTPNRPKHYYHAMAFVLLAGLAALVWAILRLPQLGQDAAAPIRARRRSTVASGELDPARVLRSHMILQGPIVWLSNRSQARRWFPWILLAVLGVVWVFLRTVAGRDWNDVPGWIATSLVVHFCLKMWLASEAPRVFHDERRSGGMELLLTTGLPTRDFIHGRVLALRHLYFGPLVAVTVLDLVMFVASVGDNGLGTGERLVVPAFWLGRIVMLWLDAAALSWTGTWIGVAARGQRTTGPTWVRVVLLPYVLWIGLCMVMVTLNMLGFAPFQRIDAGDNVGFIIILTLGLNFVVSCAWWAWAASHLKSEFRARFSLPLGVRPNG